MAPRKGQRGAVADAFVVPVDMLLPVGAGGIVVLIGDFEHIAVVIAPAPDAPFAGGRAAFFLPIPATAPGNGAELLQVELLRVGLAALFDLLIDPFGIERG